MQCYYEINLSNVDLRTENLDINYQNLNDSFFSKTHQLRKSSKIMKIKNYFENKPMAASKLRVTFTCTNCIWCNWAGVILVQLSIIKLKLDLKKKKKKNLFVLSNYTQKFYVRYNLFKNKIKLSWNWTKIESIGPHMHKYDSLFYLYEGLIFQY